MTAVTLSVIRHKADGSIIEDTITVDPDSPEAQARKAAIAERRAAMKKETISPVQQLTDLLLAKGIITEKDIADAEAIAAAEA